MKIEFSYYVIYKSQILSLSDEKTLEKFIEWNKNHGDLVRLPWGGFISNLEGWLVEEGDFLAQEEVFTDCDLDIQNLIYKLKQLQLKEDPQSKAHLAFE